MHGWGRTHRDLLECLAGSDAIALDLPGFGASPAPSAAGGAAAYADAVEPVLDECASQVVVLGHSFGGRVAVELAARRPDAVASLVLCGVPLLRRTDRPTPRPALRFRLAHRLHRCGLLAEGTMERMRQRYGSADYRAANGIMREVLVTVVNETYESQLSRIAQPVELVWGRHDEPVPVEIARRAAGMLADARLTVLDGVGHLVPTEAPAALAAAVRRQLAHLP
ncbi:alpha/beta fold hydrolase [Candidatus Poriferisodalis sp.]|uniref:alpha/beta fold hydrolase n=1 Tax=Candidatus Poriferisodalis sp. TaxID=3101277 RepID=UPI003B528C95